MNLDPEGISDLERKCVRQQCRTMYVCVLQSGHLGVLVEVGQDQNTSLPICATGIPSNLLNYRGHEGRGEERRGQRILGIQDYGKKKLQPLVPEEQLSVCICIW